MIVNPSAFTVLCFGARTLSANARKGLVDGLLTFAGLVGSKSYWETGIRLSRKVLGAVRQIWTTRSVTIEMGLRIFNDACAAIRRWA